jgi:hypothetical protein
MLMFWLICLCAFYFFGLVMLWGKYRPLVHDQRSQWWQAQATDGRSLLIVVALELGPQREVG